MSDHRVYQVEFSIRQGHAEGASAFRVHVPIKDDVQQGEDVVVIDNEETRMSGRVEWVEQSHHDGCNAIVIFPRLGVTMSSR